MGEQTKENMARRTVWSLRCRQCCSKTLQQCKALKTFVRVHELAADAGLQTEADIHMLERLMVLEPVTELRQQMEQLLTLQNMWAAAHPQNLQQQRARAFCRHARAAQDSRRAGLWKRCRRH